jgi:hypothetical protein
MRPAGAVRGRQCGYRWSRSQRYAPYAQLSSELSPAHRLAPALGAALSRDAASPEPLHSPVVAAAAAAPATQLAELPTDIRSQLSQMSSEMLAIRQGMETMLSTADRFLQETSVINSRLKLRTQDESLLAAVANGVRQRQKLAAPVALGAVSDVTALLRSVQPAQQLKGQAAAAAAAAAAQQAQLGGAGAILQAPEDAEERLAAGLDDVSRAPGPARLCSAQRPCPGLALCSAPALAAPVGGRPRDHALPSPARRCARSTCCWRGCWGGCPPS